MYRLDSVARPERRQVAEELAQAIAQHDGDRRQVTCLCCVPTLLASLERDLPKLRILLIGGEACPPALAKRWSRPGRVLLNSYGPTETTVTATLGRLSPEKPVTIGRPLPTYSIAILDPNRDEAFALGETGEIAIGGIGVAEGYLNRHELTEARFIPDILGLPNGSPSDNSPTTPQGARRDSPARTRMRVLHCYTRPVACSGASSGLEPEPLIDADGTSDRKNSD